MDAIKYTTLGFQAINATEKEFPGQGHDQDNPPDAYRHAVWAGKLARLMGEKKAKIWLEANEEIPGNPKDKANSL